MCCESVFPLIFIMWSTKLEKQYLYWKVWVVKSFLLCLFYLL